MILLVIVTHEVPRLHERPGFFSALPLQSNTPPTQSPPVQAWARFNLVLGLSRAAIGGSVCHRRGGAFFAVLVLFYTTNL